MTRRNSGVKGTLRNILVAGALGLSTLGGISQSYAQESNTPPQGSKYGYDTPAEKMRELDRAANPQKYDDLRKANDNARYSIEEARRQGKVLTQRREDGVFVITHPEYGSIEAKNLSEYISVMANSIKASEENMKKGVSVLESEVERGYLSPERTKEAKTALVEAIKNYEIVKSMYGNLHFNPQSPFKREVDFFAPQVREELFDTDRKERVPYPSKMVIDFADFSKKHQLDSETRNGFGQAYTGEIGKPIRKALEELDEVIKKEVQQEIKTRRYVPWSGFGERIDEFIHPGVGDGWEIGLSMAAIMALVAPGIGYLIYRLDKSDKKPSEDNKNETSKPEIKEPEPEIEVINPWDINFHNKNFGGSK